MSPESLDPRNTRVYRRRGRLGLGLGAAGAPIALAGLIDHDLIAQSSAGVTLSGPVDTIWLIGYLLGAILTPVGLLWRPIPRPELEVLGLWLFLGAMLTNATAIVVTRGPVAGGLTAVGLFGLSWVLKARIDDLEEAGRTERRRNGHRNHNGPERRRHPRHPDG